MILRIEYKFERMTGWIDYELGTTQPIKSDFINCIGENDNIRQYVYDARINRFVRTYYSYEISDFVMSKLIKLGNCISRDEPPENRSKALMGLHEALLNRIRYSIKNVKIEPIVSLNLNNPNSFAHRISFCGTRLATIDVVYEENRMTTRVDCYELSGYIDASNQDHIDFAANMIKKSLVFGE